MSEQRSCPDCEQGKHQNCTGEAWDVVKDEPCRCPCQSLAHVQVRDAVAVHGALGAAQLEIQHLEAEVARVGLLFVRTLDERNERDATIERVRALLNGWQSSLVGNGYTDSNKFVSIADIRAALEPSS